MPRLFFCGVGMRGCDVCPPRGYFELQFCLIPAGRRSDELAAGKSVVYQRKYPREAIS